MRLTRYTDYSLRVLIYLAVRPDGFGTALDPDLMRGPVDRLARTVVHELVHVRQFTERGYLRFMLGYVGAYLRSRFGGTDHRQAYMDNPAEVEAREVTARFV